MDCTTCGTDCASRDAGLESIPDNCEHWTQVPCKDEHRGGCKGKIEYRMNPYTWRSWGAMCDKHYEERWELEQRCNRDYGIHSSIAPSWIDPTYAGEEW